MKRSDDPTGLQFLFTGLVAIALAFYLAGAFVYRIYTLRNEPQAHDDQDNQQ